MSAKTENGGRQENLQPETVQRVVSAIQLLGSDSETEHQSGQQIIQIMGPDDVKLLLRYFYYGEPWERQAHKRRYWIFIIVGFLLGVLLAQWRSIFPGMTPGPFGIIAFGYFFSLLGLFAAFEINSSERGKQREVIFGRRLLPDKQTTRWWRRIYQRVVQALALSHNPALLPILLNGRRSCWWFFDLTPAVTLLLTRLDKADAKLLDSYHRTYLYSSLKMRYADLKKDRMGYLLAIIEFAERVGDPAGMPAVRSLAKSRARTPNQQLLKKAALDCLERLQRDSE